MVCCRSLLNLYRFSDSNCPFDIPPLETHQEFSLETPPKSYTYREEEEEEGCGFKFDDSSEASFLYLIVQMRGI